MSAFRDAQNIYRAIKNDPAAIKAKRDEYKAAALALTGPNGAMKITKSMVNGQEFWAQHDKTAAETLEILTLVVQFLDAGVMGKTQTRGRFY